MWGRVFYCFLSLRVSLRVSHTGPSTTQPRNHYSSTHNMTDAASTISADRATGFQPHTAGAPAAAVVAAEAPWYTHFPAPKSAPGWLPQRELLTWLQAGAGRAALVPGRDFLLVDLRRNDHAGGTITGSLNLPAQSLWWSLPVVYELGMKMRTRKVVFYCGA